MMSDFDLTKLAQACGFSLCAFAFAYFITYIPFGLCFCDTDPLSWVTVKNTSWGKITRSYSGLWAGLGFTLGFVLSVILTIKIYDKK